jgi:hypothetical protein
MLKKLFKKRYWRFHGQRLDDEKCDNVAVT